MDTKWMNGKLVVPAALVMSLSLIGCSKDAEEVTADDAAEQVDAATTEAPATAPATTDTDAAKTAVDDAAGAAKEAVDDAAGGGG